MKEKQDSVVDKLFDFNSNISLFFVSLLVMIYVFFSAYVNVAIRFSYLASSDITAARSYVPENYIDSPLTIVPFLLGLAPISFRRKFLSFIVLLFAVVLGILFHLGYESRYEIADFGSYFVILSVFIKEFGLDFIGHYSSAFLIGCFLYLFLIKFGSVKHSFALQTENSEVDNGRVYSATYQTKSNTGKVDEIVAQIEIPPKS